MQKKTLNLLLTLFLTFFVSNLDARIRQSYGGTLSKMKAFRHSSFFLNKLTFESDVAFSSEEFFYLTDLKIDSFVNLSLVNQAYKNLMNKNRFSSIDIDLLQEGNGNHLHFILKGAWVLKKLEFRGVIFDKQQYINLYAQQPGHAFDTTLHEESIKNIKTFLYDQGYLDSIVTDELIYSKDNKTIKACIHVTRKKRFLIKNITVKVIDAQRHSKQDIDEIKKIITKRLSSTLIKTRYSKQRIKKQSKKIKNFLKSKNFPSTRIFMNKSIDKHKKTLTLSFTLKAGKRKILFFEGNHLFSDQCIKEELIGLDEPNWLFSPDIISEQLLHEYYKKGYWECAITYTKDADTNSYTFIITEGKPVLVEQVEVKDSETQLPEDTSFFWLSLLKTKTLDQTLLDESIEKLKNFYISEGFWDFKIVEKKFIKSGENNKYNISLLVSKGKQHFWGGLSVPQYTELESADFFKKYLITDSRDLIPFNVNWLKEQKVSLLNHFQRLGYWYVTIQPTLQINSLSPAEQEKNPVLKDGVKVFVDWQINPGPQVTFGKILLQGNTKLPFKRVIKEIKFKEGDVWDKDKIELTRKKLKRLDIFKQVQIQPYQLSKNKSKKPIIVTLIDDDPLELRLRAGYFLTSKNFLFKRQSTPKGGASLVIKNPTNRADKFVLDADATYFERKVYASYQQPSFMGLPGMGKIKGFSHKYVHPVQIGSSSSAYEAIQNGVLVGLSDEYKDCYYWGISVGNEWTKTSRVRGDLKFDPALVDRTLPYFFIEPSLIIDKLDDRVNTTKGGLSFFSLKLMIPEDKGIITARLMLEQSFFYPLYHDLIFASRVRFGHIFRRDFEQIMPIERFYLGGPFSLRGYEKDALPPLGVTQRINEQGEQVTEYTIQGGGSMINGNAELRFPLFNKLGGVLFQDIGILSQSGLAGFKDKWYPSSGFGLRYKTPIGAIRFDLGWKWQSRLAGDTPYAWVLTLGEAF